MSIIHGIIGSFAGGGGGYGGSISTFADLPTNVSEGIYYVQNSTGVMFTSSRKKKGFYRKIGTEWVLVSGMGSLEDVIKTNQDEISTLKNKQPLENVVEFKDATHYYYAGDRGSTYIVNRYNLTNYIKTTATTDTKPTTLDECIALSYS